jgi:hypothetical protein
MKVSEYQGVISDRVPATESMKAKYEHNLAGNASLIKSRLDAKITNKADYQKNLAEPAINGFSGVLNPAYISKHQRNYAQMKEIYGDNLAKSYDKWRRKIEKVFADDAKIFKDAVAIGKDSWAEEAEKKVLRLSGDKVRQRGPATVGSYWLIGEGRAVGWLKPGDMSDGGPFNIVVAGLQPAFQAGFVQRVVQAALMVIARKFDAAELTYQNDLTNHLVQTFVDPGLGLIPFATGAESCVDLKKVDSLFILHIKVSQV